SNDRLKENENQLGIERTQLQSTIDDFSNQNQELQGKVNKLEVERNELQTESQNLRDQVTALQEKQDQLAALIRRPSSDPVEPTQTGHQQPQTRPSNPFKVPSRTT